MFDPRFYSLNGPLTLASLIEGLEVSVEPNFFDEEIKAPSALATAEVGALSFLQDKRRKSDLDGSKATACLVTERLAPAVSEQKIIPIISASPRAHFARMCEKLVTAEPHKTEQAISSEAEVHPTAIIGPGVHLAKGVKIGPFSVLHPGVSVGENTEIGSHVTLSFCEIGENCRIKAGAVIGGAGFGVANDERGFINIPHLGIVRLGDRVSVGSQTCIDRGQLEDTVLGNDVKVDNLVQIAHNVKIGDGSMLAGHVGISGSCIVGKNVQMGGNVGLADHLTIGDNVMIAARAGVMHDIPDGEAWSGIPAMPIREHMRVINATRKLAQRPKKDAS
jgi:UDP-3-O-[3-hydroxymyristoyl] glucosamine N-acyltransferase